MKTLKKCWRARGCKNQLDGNNNQSNMSKRQGGTSSKHPPFPIENLHRTTHISVLDAQTPQELILLILSDLSFLDQQS